MARASTLDFPVAFEDELLHGPVNFSVPVAASPSLSGELQLFGSPRTQSTAIFSPDRPAIQWPGGSYFSQTPQASPMAAPAQPAVFDFNHGVPGMAVAPARQAANETTFGGFVLPARGGSAQLWYEANMDNLWRFPPAVYGDPTSRGETVLKASVGSLVESVALKGTLREALRDGLRA